MPSQAGLVLRVWDGLQFGRGTTSIRGVFETLAQTYGRPAASSAAIDRASTANIPLDDLLGRQRGAVPDIRAYELVDPHIPGPGPTPIPIPRPRTPSLP